MALPTTVGIEIEVNQKDLVMNDLRGLTRLLTAERLHWEAKLDNSCGRLAGEKGLEIVSPLLGSYPDLEQIPRVVGLLQREDYTVNTRCGLHVHLGVQDTSIEDRQRLMRFLVRYEDAFFLLAQASRASNIFCQRLDPNLIADVRAGRDNASWQARYHPRRNPRYFWINGSMSRYRTFEFRLMESVLDAPFIVGWTSLLLMAYDNIVRRDKSIRWGRVKAKTAYICVCTMLEQAGCYNSLIDEQLRTPARKWALEQLDQVLSR